MQARSLTKGVGGDKGVPNGNLGIRGDKSEPLRD